MQVLAGQGRVKGLDVVRYKDKLDQLKMQRKKQKDIKNKTHAGQYTQRS